MGQCLVTVLKERVANDNLLKIGEIRFVFTGEGTILVKGANGQKLTVISGTGRLNETETEVTLDGTTTLVSGACVLSLSNKYLPTEIQTNNGGLDVSQLDYSNNLTKLHIDNSQSVTGDINGIDTSVIRILRLYGCDNVQGDIASLASIAYQGATVDLRYSAKIVGNIASLCENKTISSFLGQGCVKLEGSVNAMLEGMLASGRTADFTFNFASTSIKFIFDNVEWSSDITMYSPTAVFTPNETNKITVNMNNSSYNVVYDGSNWSSVEL